MLACDLLLFFRYISTQCKYLELKLESYMLFLDAEKDEKRKEEVPPYDPGEVSGWCRLHSQCKRTVLSRGRRGRRGSDQGR